MEQSYTSGADYSGTNTKIGIVAARFNGNIVEAMKVAALEALLENNVDKKDITNFYVPGAFELPLVCKNLAASKKYDGIIALGCVIRGDTPHFDYVCQGSTAGILQASLDTNIPIAFGVLTTNTIDQALLRSSLDNANNNKGRDVALCVLETINILRSINK